MTRIRQWTTIGVVAVLIVAIAGWFLAVAPQRSHASQLRSQHADVLQANATLQSRLQQLKTQVSKVSSEQARIAAIQSKLPAQPELASYVRALTSAASASHVDLVSIAPGSPTAVAAATPAAPPQPASSASPSDGSGATAAGSGTGTSAHQATGAQSEALQSISVNLVVNGDYFAIRDFLSHLEALPRVTLVTSIGLAPGTPLVPQGQSASSDSSAQWKTLQGTISLTIFMATAPSAVPGAAAPAAPAAPAATAAANN